MKPRAVVFDAYGTLFDVHSLVTPDNNDIVGDLRAFSLLRQRQLEYTWLRSLMERYEDFWNVTEAALRSAVRQLQIRLDDAQLARLMESYLFPSAFQDVKPALKSLAGLPLVILSNGSMKMLGSAVRHNGLESSFAEIISVDQVRTSSHLPGFTRLEPNFWTFRLRRSCSYRPTPGMSPARRRLVTRFAGATGPGRIWISSKAHRTLQ